MYGVAWVRQYLMQVSYALHNCDILSPALLGLRAVSLIWFRHPDWALDFRARKVYIRVNHVCAATESSLGKPLHLLWCCA